jgi:ribonucleoside-triphosphate reductase
MFEGIRKRGGLIVEFDSSKITSAIAKAGKATGEFGEREARKLTLRVLTLAHELRLDSVPEVEEIQDIVERVLLDSPFYKTAKAYILYREQHAQIRSIAAKASVDLVENYLQGLDWKIKENSNMCYSLQGLNNYISSDITSEYWLNRIYPPSAFGLLRWLGSQRPAHAGLQGRGGKSGKCPAQASQVGPGSDCQLLLYLAG